MSLKEAASKLRKELNAIYGESFVMGIAEKSPYNEEERLVVYWTGDEIKKDVGSYEGFKVVSKAVGNFNDWLKINFTSG